MNKLAYNQIIILGAGASNPYNFPLGTGLFEDISTIVNNLIPLEDRVNRNEYSSSSSNKYLHELQRIGDLLRFSYVSNNFNARFFLEKFLAAEYESFDEFLDINSNMFDGFADFGKQIITTIFHGKEVNSQKLKPINQDHWYNYLWTNYKNIFLSSTPNIAFITFNYDRSLDAYLLNQLKTFHATPIEQFNKIPIIHVYGSAGHVTELPYGKTDKILLKDFIGMSKNIRTIYEAEQNDKVIEYAQDLIANAHGIFITGFGFNAKNVDIIFKKKTAGRVIVNAFDRTPLEKNRVADLIRKYHKGPNPSIYMFENPSHISNNLRFIRHNLEIA